MFNNIGKKIMGLAKAVCWLGIICSCISGIAFMAIDEELILVGIPVAIVGSFFSWLGSLSVYGFGKLIDNTDILVQQNRKDFVPPYPQAGGYAPVPPVNAPMYNQAPVQTPVYKPAPNPVYNPAPVAPVVPVAPVTPVAPVVQDQNEATTQM